MSPLFSTNPRFLGAQGDSPDLIAVRCLIQAGFVPSDRSLTSEVCRAPAGQAITSTCAGINVCSWFDFGDVPEGVERVTDQAIADMEEQFQVAPAKCLSLSGLDCFLPLAAASTAADY